MVPDQTEWHVRVMAIALFRQDGLLDSQSGSGHPWSSGGEQRARYKEVGEIAFIAEKGAEVQKNIRDNPLGLLERVVNRGLAALVVYTPFSMMEEYEAGGWPVFFSRCVHPLPLVAIFVVLALGSIPIERNIFIAIAFFGLLLSPYILVSYYDRYAAMLVGLKMLLVLYGWDALVLALFPRDMPNHVHVQSRPQRTPGRRGCCDTAIACADVAIDTRNTLRA